MVRALGLSRIRTGSQVSARSGTWGSDIVAVDGIRIHARTRRPAEVSGPHLVFLHGLLVSSRYMEPTARRLWDEVPVWAPDMPGFGRSGRPRHVLDVAELATTLRRWLEVRGLVDVVLVANSFGCQYAVDLVARDRRGVRGLALLGPTTDASARGAVRQAFRYVLNVPFERLSMAAVLARDLLDAGVPRVAATLRHMLNDAIEQKLPHVGVPTVVVRGERDTIVPQDWVERVVHLLPDADLRVIPRAAHTINYNSPDVTATILRDFLRNV